MDFSTIIVVVPVFGVEVAMYGVDVSCSVILLGVVCISWLFVWFRVSLYGVVIVIVFVVEISVNLDEKDGSEVDIGNGVVLDPVETLGLEKVNTVVTACVVTVWTGLGVVTDCSVVLSVK